MSADGVTSGVNTDVPNVARIYDYFLGGKDNFPADRAAAAKIAETAPEVMQRVRENREFLGRAVGFLSGLGIRQFLDLGAGLPTRESVHQVARRLVPAARVAYVDYDPDVVVHSQALLAADPDAIAIEADMREPEVILRQVTERGLIDLAQPVAVLMLAVLHFIPDNAQAEQIVATFREQMTDGSYLAITHATAGNMSSENLAQAVRTYAASSAGSITLRSPDQIEAFFHGLELEEPGVVPAAHWRPGTAAPPAVYGPTFLGGLARKPASPR
jgi:O-methyltransferase involved in polyketide biosynthesis